MASIGVIIVFCITFLFFLFFYKNGSLAPERIKLLGDIDGWSWGERSSPIKIPWEANLTYLKQFIAKEGHAKVPLTFKTDDGNSLGRWVTNQRANHKNGSLAPERIKLLKDIKGWVWSAKK
jgi:hypothetical protein